MNKDDIEFYHASLVMKIAALLANKPFDSLSHQSKQRNLNKAVSILYALLNDPDLKRNLS